MPGPLDNLEEAIRELQDLYDDPDIVIPASQLPEKENPYKDFEDRNPMAGGGMLVQPSADGSRPGYAGKKSGLKEKTTVAEGNKLAKQYNKIITTAFDKGDMSKIPSWKSFLESKTLKHAGTAYYRTNAANFGVINATAKKFELADRLIDEASKTLKYTEWMDIQKKLSPFKEIDTRTWREYIDKNTRINGQAAKVSQAFDYLYDNDIQLKIPKNLSKTMVVEGSILRKVIADITGAGKRAIINGLNMNDAYNKNIDQIKFANQGNLWTQGEGRTLSEILENADYRMKGNISWTSDIKLSNRANKNVFDYALRNFNYHQLNKTGEGTIQFYDKKTNKPIDWNTLPKNKNGFRVLKPNSVYFIDASMPNKKWDMTSIDADNLKWSKGKGSSGLFDEVFQAKDKYDKLLATKVDDPRNPKKQISFGKLMSEVYKTGFDNFGNPYAIEHSDGVANNPFKNLKIASQRVNSALSSLNRDTKLSKSQKNKLFKELQKNVFNPADENMIVNLIKSTQPLQSDVLVKGQTITGSELDNLLLKLSGQIDSDCAGAIKQASKDGGRIGLQAIGSRDVCITKAKNYARDQVAKGIPDTGVKGSLIKRIFKSTNDFVKSALDPKELFDIKKQFFSKGAIASLPIFDAGIAGYEALAMNKPVKEAISDTFTFGSIPRAMGIGMDTSQVIQAKNLLNNPNLSPAGKEYAQLLIDSNDYANLTKNKQRVLGSLEMKGGAGTMPPKEFEQFSNEAITKLENKIKNASTAGRFDYESLLNEIQATQLAKDEYSPLIGSLGEPLKNRAVAPRTGTRQGKGSVKIDLSPITYQNFQPNIPSKEVFDDYLRNINMIGQDEELTEESYQKKFYKPAEFEQLMEVPGFKGTQDKFATGGRAGFKVGDAVRKGVLSLIDDSLKKTPKDTTSILDKLIKKTLDEDLFDKKDRIIDSINISETKKRKNYPYNQQVFEEPKNLDFYDAITKSNFRTKTGPYFDRIRRLKKAGGGLLKQAGDRSGPPPESGPNPQGLQGLLNRVKKI